MDFTIRFDSAYLHNDLENIRNQRPNMGTIKNAHNITIELPQYGNLSVIAKSCELWIDSYKKNGTAESFGTNLNYNDSDCGCALTFDQIKGVLAKLLTLDYKKKDFISSNNARTSYIMCVFVASELVRNEFLETVLLHGETYGMTLLWKYYKPLYKNWHKTSQLLYGISSGGYCPEIRVNDLKNHINRLANTDLSDSVINIYRTELSKLP